MASATGPRTCQSDASDRSARRGACRDNSNKRCYSGPAPAPVAAPGTGPGTASRLAVAAASSWARASSARLRSRWSARAGTVSARARLVVMTVERHAERGAEDEIEHRDGVVPALGRRVRIIGRALGADDHRRRPASGWVGTSKDGAVTTGDVDVVDPGLEARRQRVVVQRRAHSSTSARESARRSARAGSASAARANGRGAAPSGRSRGGQCRAASARCGSGSRCRSR